MRTYAYPARIEELAPDDVLVTFRDLPEAITGATTVDAARDLAADALDTVVLHRLAQGESVPLPSELEIGEELVMLDPVTAARAALAAAMTEQKVSNVALALRLGRSEHAVRRLLDGSKGVKIDTLLLALGALGRRAALAIDGT